MAISESIKRRMHNLQDECAWSQNLVQSLIAAKQSENDQNAEWVLLLERTVKGLVKRSDQLVTAIYHADRRGPQ